MFVVTSVEGVHNLDKNVNIAKGNELPFTKKKWSRKLLHFVSKYLNYLKRRE
jgi:hypothetical protein